MKRVRCCRLLSAWVLAIAVLLAGLHPAAAQGGGLQLQIGRPAEGETLYAGPSSLQYNIPINGWAYSERYDSPQLEVLLEVLQNGNVLSTQSVHPNPDGSFLFNAMVNPHNSAQVFPAEHAGCADYCHFPVDLALPPGALTLRLTAIEPGGTRVVGERHITVDLAEIATVPARLVLIDQSGHSLQGVRVSASTRLYLWRTRHALAAADTYGQVLIPVEVLADAPTRYLFQVEPQLVNGVLFAGTEAVEVTLEPGSDALGEITLPVRTQTGRIEGQIHIPGLELPTQVLAFHLPEGACQQVWSGESGAFAFEDLAIGQYLITTAASERPGFDIREIYLDLREDPQSSVELAGAAVAGLQLDGQVLREDGQPLPFARVAASSPDGTTLAAAVQPLDGGFRLSGVSTEQRSLIASAPGYYSQALALADAPGQALEFKLVTRPETSTLPWGSGAVVIPPETGVQQNGRTLFLTYGWLWGQGQGPEPLEIQYEDLSLRILGGRFALEAVPGQAAWFYLFDGQAELRLAGAGQPVPVQAGQMVALDTPGKPQPVAYHLELVSSLQARHGAPALDPIWQPGLAAILRDWLARLGIGVAQAITLMTSLFVTLAVISGPLLILLGVRRLRRQQSRRS